MNQRGGCGGCFTTILILLVIGATFGVIEWETVGSYVKGIIYFFGFIFLMLFLLFLYLIFLGKNVRFRINNFQNRNSNNMKSEFVEYEEVDEENEEKNDNYKKLN